jgi:dynein heavy chain
MPLINEWGDQVTNEIVRELMEEHGFYSLERPGEFTTIIRTQFLAAMCTPGGGRNDIPGRLKRHFAVFNCIMPDAGSIERIYSTILQGYFTQERGFKPQVIELAAKLTGAIRQVWAQVKVKMLPTPAKFHYVFNLRDLSRVTQGIIQVTSKYVNTPDGLLPFGPASASACSQTSLCLPRTKTGLRVPFAELAAISSVTRSTNC